MKTFEELRNRQPICHPHITTRMTPNNRITSNPLYQGWRRFILDDTNEYDFLLTITFARRQYDDVFIKSVSHLLNVINASLTSQRFRSSGRYIEGFAFLERHVKSLDKEGGLHVHILGYFPQSFDRNPTLEEFKSKVFRALSHVTSNKGNQMIYPSEVDVRHPFDEVGLMDYLSKQLTIENLDQRILLVGKDGLMGHVRDWDFPQKFYQ